MFIYPFKIKVTYTSHQAGDQYFKDYFKEFNTHEELACFILDLADKEGEEIVVKPANSEVYGTDGINYRVVEVYNDYRE